ncbi:restriction endonuclease subunit S [Clostridiaceae bacterium OF09-1]|nr:restriction endonuclease subunit S [Clostridiaceae bacterium OF09-1]
MGKPKIRFKGYADDWEQRKLVDYLEVSKNKNKNEAYGKEDVLSVSGEFGIVNQIEFQGRSFAGASVVNYGVVEVGDIVYTKSPLKSNPYGIIKTNKGKSGIVSTLYAVYKPKENCDSEFVQTYFELDSRMNSYMHPLVNKGAKNDMKVSDENALKGSVNFPKFEEQKAISQYFESLNTLITLHQRKCDETKKLKKYMLQKMFPQNGEKVPKIRFAGFSDDWEQRKLSEVAKKTYGGGTPRTSEEAFWNGRIPWLQSADLIEHEVLSAMPKKGITDAGLQNSAAQLIPKNSIAIVTRVGVGKLAFMPFEYATSQDFLSLCNLNIDGKFGCYVLYRLLQKEKNLTQGTSIKGITKEELLNKELLVPKQQEQVQIGKYFSTLDHLITLHQQKCDELQNIKKFMLKNMFA